jgi:hypothetical protein
MNTHQQLIRRWRQQMTRRLCASPYHATPPLVVMSHWTDGPVVDGLIEVENLRLAVLYEEPSRRRFPAIRFSAYSGERVMGKVVLGGDRNSRLFKEVTARPAWRTRDQRLDTAKPQVVNLALRMEAHLRRQKLHPYKPRQTEMPLPRLFAGFRASTARRLGLAKTPAQNERTGDGGSVSARTYFELTLLPVDDVSRHLGEATAVLAELAGWPRLRVVQLPDLRDGLRGLRGPIEFDFYSSRFRGWPGTRRTSRRPAVKCPQAA